MGWMMRMMIPTTTARKVVEILPSRPSSNLPRNIVITSTHARSHNGTMESANGTRRMRGTAVCGMNGSHGKFFSLLNSNNNNNQTRMPTTETTTTTAKPALSKLGAAKRVDRTATTTTLIARKNEDRPSQVLVPLLARNGWNSTMTMTRMMMITTLSKPRSL